MVIIWQREEIKTFFCLYLETQSSALKFIEIYVVVCTTSFQQVPVEEIIICVKKIVSQIFKPAGLYCKGRFVIGKLIESSACEKNYY